MNRLRRYWTLWRTLPEDERSMRTGRLIDRLLRQRPAVRRLRLAPDLPRRGSFRRALSAPPVRVIESLRGVDERRGPWFADLEPRARAIAAAHPEHVDHVLAQTAELLESRFDLLGSGPSQMGRGDGGLDWHRDWKSGLAWPADSYHLDLVTVRGDGSDVKLPWELSRFQHLLVIGQAYRFAADRLPRNEAEALKRRCATTMRDQIDDWIEHNPRGLGVNWSCTMDVAIRAINWLAALGLMREAPELDDDFLSRMLRSLWAHGLHIRRNLEVGADGLTSNHYLSDIIGLLALGCALRELRAAAAWSELSSRALVVEMEHQVHADGVDFERSIPYHRLVTEIFLHGAMLARGEGAALPASYHDRLASMLEFIASYTRPDGSLPQWGDNDDGRLLPFDGYAAPDPNDHRHLLELGGSFLEREDLRAAGGGRDVEALWLLGAGRPSAGASPAGRTSRGFDVAGYYVMRAGDLHAAVPCGPVGTAGLGNHTHNDSLSICVWAGGREWITDPGTGAYTGDPELRNRLRSTAAHATLQPGTLEQNSFGSSVEELFRMEQRARPDVDRWSAEDDGARLCASLRFGEADAAWTHRREVRFEPAGRHWLLHDRLTAADGGADRRPETTFLRFPLPPGVSVETRSIDAAPPEIRAGLDTFPDLEGLRNRTACKLFAGDSSFWIGFDLPAGSDLCVVQGIYSPSYGVVLPAPVVVAAWPTGRDATANTILWSPPRFDV